MVHYANTFQDLDSLCSAVVFAYLRTYSGSKTIHVPLSNLLRADLDLRPELRPVLSRANIKASDLITLSDLPLPSQRVSALEPAKTRWILVDHNALQGELGKVYSSKVIGVIDHHDEENQVPKNCGDEPRIVTKSGSCSSLVVEYCKVAWDGLSKSPTGETTAWDAELAHLALAPILIDTNNLEDNSKVTPIDIEAVKYLESKIAASSVKYNRDDYFNNISTAKGDIGQLTIPDMLRKDYKQLTGSGSANLGISCVVKPVPFLLKKAEDKESALLDSIYTFAADRRLSLFALMTTSSSDSGKLVRELLVLSLDAIGAEAAAAFEQNAAEILGLKSWGKGLLDCKGAGGAGADAGDQGQGQHGWKSRCWVQEKVENSRKQVGPLLRKALHDAAAGAGVVKP
jgi:exopolyphosphatase